MKGVVGTVNFEWEECDECKHGITSGGCDKNPTFTDALFNLDFHDGIYDVICRDFEEGENHD